VRFEAFRGYTFRPTGSHGARQLISTFSIILTNENVLTSIVYRQIIECPRRYSNIIHTLKFILVRTLLHFIVRLQFAPSFHKIIITCNRRHTTRKLRTFIKLSSPVNHTRSDIKYAIDYMVFEIEKTIIDMFQTINTPSASNDGFEPMCSTFLL
jgi:hypothetical protein